MKISNNHILLIIILILGVFLRFYHLGTNPPSLDWDEASLGYNAYSLLKTGKDEYGRSWPISIRSFGDYKPAVYTYLTIPSIALFGLNEFAVRLPSAVLGSLTVLIVYFLLKELFDVKIALLSAFLLAISPWHLQFSRVAFESNAALFFVITGSYFFLKGKENGKYLLLSSLFFTISFYTYHSPRLVVPLLLVGWLVIYRKQLWQQRYYAVSAMILGSVILLPFVSEVFSSGSARLSSVTVLTPEGRLDTSIQHIEYDASRKDLLGKILHNRRIIYAQAIAKGYLDHYNFDFLFLTGDAPDRHHAKDMGMLYVWEAGFIVVGIITLLKAHKGAALFWWFLVAPAASAITTGTPHAVRALIYLPTYQVFTAVGLVSFYDWITNRTSSGVSKTVIGIVALIIAANSIYYFDTYYIHTPIEASRDWQYGYKQMVTEVNKWESSVDHVVVTYAYDQPYVYFLFYNKIDPSWYQREWSKFTIERDIRRFGKYEFKKLVPEDLDRSNSLLVGTPAEIPHNTQGIVAEIPFLNGEIALRIVKR